MNKIFCLFSLFILSLPAFCQNEISRSKEWVKFYEDDKVRMYSRYYDCNRPQDGIYAEYVLLRAENKTSEPVNLIWYTDIYLDGGCTNCDHSLRDRQRSVILKPLESIEGDCEPGLNIGLKVFSKWLRMKNDMELTKLNVTDISTNFIH